MLKTSMRKTKWTLSFNPKLKILVVETAKRRGIHPATLLENLVREKLNPFGHADVNDSAAYTASLRKRNRSQSDEEFMADLHAWHKSRSS